MRTICVAVVVLLGGCGASVPTTQDDACIMLRERGSWRKAVRLAEKKWGVSAGYQMAVVKFESSFDPEARTRRKRYFFGLLPGKRISTAYGYAQALDGTFDAYRRDTGNRTARRTRFGDATDFIGWYTRQTHKRAKLDMSDYRNHYIAYHEGAGGYLKGSWRTKKKLIAKSDRLAKQARIYDGQIEKCRFRRFLGIF